MNKWQAIDAFWNGFSLPAYDENTVPDDATMPYITYAASEASFEQPITLTGSIWYRSTLWDAISCKASEIAQYIGPSYKAVKLDDGYMVLTKGTPFAQRMADEDDSVRRMYVMIDAEFCTEV